MTKHGHYYYSFFSWFRIEERYVTFDGRAKVANGAALGDLVTEQSKANPLCRGPAAV